MSRPDTDKTKYLLIFALLLILFFGLAVGSMLDKSPTFDEEFYIARGWAFLLTGELLPLGHPPLTNTLSGLGVLLEPGLPDPKSLDGWSAKIAEDFSEDFLWNQGLNTNRIVFLARMPMVWLGLLLASVVWRWARDLYSVSGAMIALSLFALSPNLLAHTRLATTELGITAFYVMTLYAWGKFLKVQTPQWLVLSGIGFGLAQASKFSALFLIPILFLITLVWLWQTKRITIDKPAFLRGWLERLSSKSWGWIAVAPLILILMGLVGVITLWGSYGFAFRPYPLEGYISEFSRFLGLATKGHRAYLLGEFSQSGWWYYHPFTMIVKMPIGSLLLIAVALISLIWERIKPEEWVILIGAGGYLGISMTGSLNVGIRYLLPILPLCFIFASRIMIAKKVVEDSRPSHLSPLKKAENTRVLSKLRFTPLRLRRPSPLSGETRENWLVLCEKHLLLERIITKLFIPKNVSYPQLTKGDKKGLVWAVATVGILLLLVENTLISPDYLAFFNTASGGPNRGYRLLSDSNIDWGQDLPGLADYLEERGEDQVYLSYFGQADPLYYGIDYAAIPAWPPSPRTRRVDFYPMFPDPGLYAISASNLIGVQLYEPESYGYFRHRESSDQIGHSILIYDVPKSPIPTWFGQCAAPEPTLSEERIVALTGLSDLTHIYFDCSQTLFYPGEPGLILLPAEIAPISNLGEGHYIARNEDGSPRYTVWLVGDGPRAPDSVVLSPEQALPIQVGDAAELLGYQVSVGETIQLRVWWRVLDPPPPPISIFAHLLAPDGSLLTSADGLGLPVEQWQPGMVIVQQHTFTIPDGTAPGDYLLNIGFYSLETGDRFPIAEYNLDRIDLQFIQIDP